MNSFQYAIAKAAWEAHYEATNEAQPSTGFANLAANKQRAWLAAAQAALDTALKFASGRAQ
jgi:predicted porin